MEKKSGKTLMDAKRGVDPGICALPLGAAEGGQPTRKSVGKGKEVLGAPSQCGTATLARGGRPTGYFNE